MKIRKAEKSDFLAIQRLNKALFDFEERFKHAYNLNWPFEKAGKEYFAKRLRQGKAIIFIAEENSEQIGYIIAFIDSYPYRLSNPICEIENMFVEGQYRRKGVGQALMEAVRSEAKRRKVRRLRVGAIAQNKNAIEFYRSQGFKDVNLYLEEEL
jgi:diamine N-acetyltransferase